MFWGHKINFPKIEKKICKLKEYSVCREFKMKLSALRHGLVELKKWSKRKEPFRNSWRKCKSPVWGKKISWLQASPHPMAEEGAVLTKVEGKKTAVETITPSQDSVQRQRQRTVSDMKMLRKHSWARPQNMIEMKLANQRDGKIKDYRWAQRTLKYWINTEQLWAL